MSAAEVITWDEYERRRDEMLAADAARENPPRSAAEFCQGVLIPSLYPKRISPYGVDGVSTGGRGGPEAASWARFSIGAEEFTVQVTRTIKDKAE